LLFGLGPFVGYIYDRHGPRPLIIGGTFLHVFAKRHGLAMGIMVTGSSVGGVIFPIMITRMIKSVGYPWAMRTGAFLVLGLQIVAILTVRPRVPPVPKMMAFGRLAAPFKFTSGDCHLDLRDFHTHHISGRPGLPGGAHVRRDVAVPIAIFNGAR
jgi:MFS family permease